MKKIKDLKAKVKGFKWNRKNLIRVVIVIFGILILFLTFYAPTLPYKPPKVVSVTPTNGANDVMGKALIKITFAKPIPAEEQESFYLRLLPGVSGNASWISSTELSFVQTQALQPSTTYKLALSYAGSNLFESQFTTRFRKTYSEQELTEIRDWAFTTSQTMYNIMQDYPFLQRLPIDTDSYNIMFDSVKNQFRYYLKMDASVPEATKQEAIDAATEDLRLIGVVVSEFGYYVTFASEEPYK